MHYLLRLFCSSALLLLLAAHPPSRAQAQAPTAQVQLGLGLIPGFGVEAGYVMPRSFYTLEGVLFVDGSPGFAGGEGSLQIAGGLGGAVRIFGILRTIGSPGYATRDLDVGLRLGPSLFFAFGDSSRDENPFALFLEPFARFSTTLGSDRVLFAELGTQRPLLRAGVLLNL